MKSNFNLIIVKILFFLFHGLVGWFLLYFNFINDVIKKYKIKQKHKIYLQVLLRKTKNKGENFVINFRDIIKYYEIENKP